MDTDRCPTCHRPLPAYGTTRASLAKLLQADPLARNKDLALKLGVSPQRIAQLRKVVLQNAIA